MAENVCAADIENEVYSWIVMPLFDYFLVVQPPWYNYGISLPLFDFYVVNIFYFCMGYEVVAKSLGVLSQFFNFFTENSRRYPSLSPLSSLLLFLPHFRLSLFYPFHFPSPFPLSLLLLSPSSFPSPPPSIIPSFFSTFPPFFFLPIYFSPSFFFPLIHSIPVPLLLFPLLPFPPFFFFLLPFSPPPFFPFLSFLFSPSHFLIVCLSLLILNFL